MKNMRVNVQTGEITGDPLTEADRLAAWRASASCSPLQGKIALGEVNWTAVEAIVSDPETPFAMRVAISSATRWQRNSQMIDELAWMLGYEPEQVDDLFSLAMQITV